VSRLERLSAELKNRKLDAFVVSNIHNVRYLSGFSGSTAILFVGPEGPVMITDFRYEEQSAAEVGDPIEVRIEKRDALTATCDLAAEVRGRTGFESGSLTYASYEKLVGAVGGELVPAEGIIEKLRRVKDPGEIDLLARAAEIADQAFSRIVKEIRPGMTEAAVAARLDFHLREISTEVPSFDTICASGPNSSLPHAGVTTRVIEEGDLLKMDFGAIWKGYCSDITRTVVVGKASEKAQEIYGIVLEAQRKALEGIKAGLTGKEVDSMARDLIASRGYGDRFGHGLGHGIGLEVHETPRLSQKWEEPLEAGAVVTVEPGIYLPGWGGIRIEDDVVIEEGGSRNLTGATKELLEIGR
jgi:Xaa-Pro aminopeptidase